MNRVGSSDKGELSLARNKEASWDWVNRQEMLQLQNVACEPMSNIIPNI